MYRGNTANPHDGETRMKFFAAKVMPYSLHDENKMLLKRLQIYSQKGDENSMMM